MGVGKGSVAREVIKHSEYIAIDTDDLIESMENRKIKTIFEQEGEKYFRKLEKNIAKWLESSVKNTLISTGGGFYKQENFCFFLCLSLSIPYRPFPLCIFLCLFLSISSTPLLFSPTLAVYICTFLSLLLIVLL